MGVWGTGLYSDDTACDVRGDYRDHLGDGLSGEEATELLLKEWGDQLDDPDVGPVFWLALADTQSKCGRLEERVKAEAIAVIDEGRDLARWEETPKDCDRRRQVLEKVRARLLGPQKPPSRIKKQWKTPRRFERGQAFCYRLRSGRLVVFTVVGEHEDKGGIYPEAVLHDWVGTSPPSFLRLQLLRPMKSRLPDATSLFMLCDGGARGFPAERVQPAGKSIAFLPSSRDRSAAVVLWPDLDRILEEWFELG